MSLPITHTTKNKLINNEPTHSYNYYNVLNVKHQTIYNNVCKVFDRSATVSIILLIDEHDVTLAW